MAGPDAFKILVATDIHVGYLEKDQVRGNDSFNTLEEVLDIAKRQSVDFVLMAGDLFHENKPSTSCLIRVTELLRKYCYGDGQIEFKLVSDQKENFCHTKSFPYVNFEEENINVSLPIFSIHGNHDDPTGKNPVCLLEALSASGLVNYFGKVQNMDNISVKPLLLKKGKAQLALYGLGSLPEERLHRLFQKKKVNFEPIDDDWFSICLVHQNRVAHGTKYLPEHFLKGVAQLVIWGHEHECIPDPKLNDQCGFHVLQPGSSVATSLCPGEAAPKHVIVLEVGVNPDGSTGYKTHPIPLKTVRPFYFESIDMDDYLGNIGKKVTPEIIDQICVQKVESLIDKATIDHTGDPGQPLLPLIRLRIDCSIPLPFSLYTFGCQFAKRVANPRDLLRYRVKRSRKQFGHTNGNDIDVDDIDSILTEQADLKIEDVVCEFFQNDEKNKLSLISDRGLTLSVREMVEKGTHDAVENYLESLVESVQQHLTTIPELIIDDRNEIINEISNFRDQIMAAEEDKSKVDVSSDAKKKTKESQGNSVDEEDGSDAASTHNMEDAKSISSDEEFAKSKKSPAKRSRSGTSRGRGRGRGRGRSSSGNSNVPYKRTKASILDDSDSDIEIDSD